MTIATTSRKAGPYTGNGVATLFGFWFKIFATTDAQVVLFDTTNSVETILTKDLHYTVSMNADQDGSPGGTITYPISGSPLAPTQRLTIVSTIAETQSTRLTVGGGFSPSVIEQRLDWLTALIQQHAEKLARSILASPSDFGPVSALPVASLRNGKFVSFDASGNPIISSGTGGGDSALRSDLASVSSGADGSRLIGFRRTDTGSAVRTLNQKAGEWLTPADFGAVLDGVTDDTTALQNWLNAAGNLLWPTATTAKITTALTLQSNTTLRMVRGATLLQATNDVAHFEVPSKTKVHISGGTLKRNSAGVAPYVAGVHFDACTSCTVEDVEFDGLQWTGVYLENSNNNTVRYNHFHNSLSSVGDSSDICIYRNSSYNQVYGNRCYGTGYHGIFCQDPGGVGTYFPHHNKIRNNMVIAHGAYGIVVYIGDAGTGANSYNEITENDVEGITGAAYTDGGAGIYCVGIGIGGLKVIGNNVRNCNINTLTRLNAPGAITVATGTSTTIIKPEVSHNTVNSQTQGDGINIASCAIGCTLVGNIVRLPSSNNGKGPGGGTLLGQALRVDNSSNIDVSGGQYVNDGTGDAVFFYASAASQTNISVRTSAKSASGNPFRMDRTAAFTFTNVSVSVEGYTTSNTPNGMQLNGIVNGAITGCAVNCGSQAVVSFSNCTGVVFTGNKFTGTGATGIATTGTCTGSYYDKSNSHTGAIANAAKGFKTEFFAAAAPASGTGAVGDRAEQATPAIGAPKGWRCIVAGSPGTWASEGNL